MSSNHLLLRGKRYYLRLHIPLDLRPWFAGKTELKRSLKTTRYNDARALIAAETVRAERLFAQIRGGLMTTEEIQGLVAAYFSRSLAETEDARADGVGVLQDIDEDGEQGDSSLTGLELHLSDMVENLARGEHGGIAHVADEILQEAGLTLDKGSHDYRKLCREALRAAIDATKTELERMRGDYRETPVFAEVTVAPVPAGGEPMLLSEAIEEFVKEHDASGHWRKKSREESEGIYRLLIGILGDVPMSTLDYKVLSGWRDALLRFPSNYTKRTAYRGKSIAEVLAMGTKTPLSITSVNKMLTQTGAFLKWSVKRGYCGANYCEGLTIRQGHIKPEEQREAYSTEDLLRLIRSPLYVEPKTDTARRKRIAHPERWWLPLLGLYTGARLNELCQLHTADVREVESSKGSEGILCLDINDNGEGKRLKNASSRRVIPVHPFLLELGFREYVDSVRGKGAERLWPALKLKRDGWSQDYGKLYQRFNRKYITTHPKRVFHSFRHCVADGLKQREVDGNVISELLGQSLGGSMALGRYGKAYRPVVLLETLKKLEYGIEEELRKLPRLE